MSVFWGVPFMFPRWDMLVPWRVLYLLELFMIWNSAMRGIAEQIRVFWNTPIMVNLVMFHFFIVEFDHELPNKNPKLVNERGPP